MISTKSLLTTIALTAVIGLGACQSNGDKQHDDGHGKTSEAVETRINMNEVPDNVRQAFERQFPHARVSAVNKETYPNGTVHYEFEFVNKDGKKMDVEFDADGERLPEH